MADSTKTTSTSSTSTTKTSDSTASQGTEAKKADGVELNVKSTAQRDLEERLANGNAYSVAVKTLSPAEQLDEVDGDFIGVDPIYQNYADDLGKPFAADGGPEADAEQHFVDTLTGEAAQPASDEVKANAATAQSGTTGA